MSRPPKFACILADPPWAFRGYNGFKVPQRAVLQHYRTMPLAELKRLPIGAVAAEHAALFMWTISSHIEQCIALAKHWGFKFKTLAFVWLKGEPGREPPITLGKWTRQQTEICLLFTKGKPRRLSGGVRQIIWEAKREHSRKPEGQYLAIEKLVAGPRLELFSRRRRRGWWHHGNDMERFT